MGLKSALKLVVAFIFRWFRFPVEPGLRIFGTPNENSLVFLTCNFILSLKRLSKYLKEQNCYLLVAPTKGINVWCAATGGEFTDHSVISIIKTSRVSELVKHRILIAPQLSAPGIDPEKVQQETGWYIKFGPVYAKDIPQYIKNGLNKTDEMQKVNFPILSRLEMATSYFITLLVVLTLPLYIFYSELYLSSIIWLCIIVYGIYILFPFLPSRSGFVKAFLSAIIGILTIMGLSIWITGTAFTYAHLLVMTILATAAVGIDMTGMSPNYRSDLGSFLYKYGRGNIQLNKEACSGCKMCYEVCPRGVFEMDIVIHKAQLIHPEKCVNCTACVHRCPEQCLAIV
ncbi:MAG: HgcAB-like fusion protein [Candidatus Hodarchaeota archaeon]